jgi:hypothetical protein
MNDKDREEFYKKFVKSIEHYAGPDSPPLIEEIITDPETAWQWIEEKLEETNKDGYMAGENIARIKRLLKSK